MNFQRMKQSFQISHGRLRFLGKWKIRRESKRYDELSKNEIGTIITGTILVDSPPGLEPMCRIDNDAYIEVYKKLTDMVH